MALMQSRLAVVVRSVLAGRFLTTAWIEPQEIAEPTIPPTTEQDNDYIVVAARKALPAWTWDHLT
jgi:hypothetical protein